MTLKHKRPPTPPEPVSTKPDNWSGPWGRINPTSSGFDVVRFCQRPDRGSEKTHSYPYRVISSWHWTDCAPEELRIETGADQVTVKGRGLERIVEALDRGTLEVLSEVPGEMPPVEEHAIWITTINVEGLQPG
jgi:hypothetical protein